MGDAVSRASAVPLHVQIRRAIQDRITSGELGPGDRLPTELEYARTFGVSIAPVRQALLDLADAGLVVRHKGRGTFVRGARLEEEIDLLELHRQPPAAWHGRPDPGPPAGADRRAGGHRRPAGVRPGTSVVHLQRLAWIDVEPAAILDAWLPSKPFARLAQLDDFEAGRSLYATLDTEFDVRLGLARSRIEVGRLSEMEAPLMQLPELARPPHRLGDRGHRRPRCRGCAGDQADRFRLHHDLAPRPESQPGLGHGRHVTIRTGSADERSIAVMRDEIATIPTVIADQATRLRPALRALAAGIGPDTADLVLTGCGDSHYAGIATRLAFQRATGLRVAATEALEFVRYDVRYVARAAARPRCRQLQRGGRPHHRGRRHGSPLRLADGRAHRPARGTAGEGGCGADPHAGPDPRLLAGHVDVPGDADRPARARRGAGSGSRSRRPGRRDRRCPGPCPRTSPGRRWRWRKTPLAAPPERLTTAATSTFIGAGPSRATAAFGAAKLFEGPQRYGVVQDLEEWAHEQYFVSGPATPIVVVAPTGASRDRAAELLAEMAFIGAPAVFVSDVVDDDAARSAAVCLPITSGLTEPYSPLLTCLPLAQAAFFVAERLGTRSYGFPSAEHEREHYATIHRATQCEPA